MTATTVIQTGLVGFLCEVTEEPVTFQECLACAQRGAPGCPMTPAIIHAILLWRFVDKVGTRGHWWLSFVFGCMIHSVIDIFTHYNDGPVLFFPFDWHIRFHSPISYWDKAHYASQFFWVELGINVVLLGYLFLPKVIKRFKKSP